MIASSLRLQDVSRSGEQVSLPNESHGKVRHLFLPLRVRLLCTAAALLFLFAGAGACADMTPFTDWTAVNTTAETASGTLSGIPISLTGGDITYGLLDGTAIVFNDSTYYDPTLPTSDFIGIAGAFNETLTYTVTFGSAVTNPVMHVQSLASTLNFPGITLTKVSGEPDFVVSGSNVTGSLSDHGDRNGTIQLPGTFTSFSFTAHAVMLFTTDRDGINIQIGGTPAVVPVPAGVVLGMIGLGMAGWLGRRRAM